MDFLDSLENSLKNLESQEERDSGAVQRRQDERTRALQLAPWAEKLKNSEYTKKLFNESALVGHRLRAKVYMAWLGDILRLEAKGRWCELRPQPDGIEAEFVRPDGTTGMEKLDLTGEPGKLLQEWLGSEEASKSS